MGWWNLRLVKTSCPSVQGIMGRYNVQGIMGRYNVQEIMGRYNVQGIMGRYNVNQKAVKYLQIFSFGEN